MVDNPTKIYNDYVRANLPNSMSYDTGTDRYDINSHSFFKFKNSNWYFNYISKYGYSALSAYAVNNFEPALVFDFKGNYFRKSATASTFGASITHAATTNATMTDGYGPDVVTNGDFASDSGWDKGTGWTISGGVATHSGGTDGNLSNTGYTVSAPSNKTVTITYTISGHTAGSVRVGLAGGNAQLLTFRAANGTYTESVTNTGGNLYVRFQTQSFLGSIDNVSVRQSPALKWRPHNRMRSSGDLTGSGWANNSMTVGAVTAGSPFGTYQTVSPSSTIAGPSSRYQIGLPLSNGATYVGWSLGKYSAGNGWFVIDLYDSGKSSERSWFDLQNGVVGTKDPLIIDHGMIDYGDGWWLCWASSNATNVSGGLSLEVPTGDGVLASNSGDVVLIAGSQFNRSDLGGMVNNPDTNSSYVPTTSAAVYAPRRGHHVYNGSAWVNEGILHESEARTNLMTSSGDVTGTGWSAQGNGGSNAGSVTAGGPFGTYQTLTPAATDNANPAQRFQIGKSITSGQTYVSSALLKYSAGSFWAVVSVYDTVTGNKRAYFDLQNGVVGTKDAAIIDSGMINYGDGWWLCWASANSGGTSGGFNIEVTNGDGVLGRKLGDVMLVAGSQFELGATPSSYIPTTIATTRAAETLTVPAANLPYDSTNMSIQIDGRMTYADINQSFTSNFAYWQLNSNNRIRYKLGTNSTNTGQVGFIQEANGFDDTVVGPAASYTAGINVPFNIAGRHGSTFNNGAVDGTALTANTTPTALPDLSATDFKIGYTFMGTIGEFRMWSDDITDAGITEATLPSTEPSLSLTFDGSETSFIVLDWSE